MTDIKTVIARELLRVQAVKLQPDAPFTWASGWKSPIYCDNRKTLSHPEFRSLIKSAFVTTICQSWGDFDAIAAVATGGIPQGALIADTLGKPLVYVRSAAKDHGLGNRIEGDLQSGARVVVVEDLVSTGGSSLKAVDALRSAGAEVVGMVAAFTYGFPQAEEAFAAANVQLETLTNYEAVIAEAAATGYVSQSDIETLKKGREDPSRYGV